jgi:hypothetical protein
MVANNRTDFCICKHSKCHRNLDRLKDSIKLFRDNHRHAFVLKANEMVSAPFMGGNFGVAALDRIGADARQCRAGFPVRHQSG